MKKKIFAICAMLMLTVLGLTGCALSFSPDDEKKQTVVVTNTTPISVSSNMSAGEVAESLLDACVTVTIHNGQGVRTGHGSGVAIYMGGYVVTNYHVVQNVIKNPNSYEAHIVTNEYANTYDCEILWYNINFDMAILKCEYPDLPFVEMEDRWIEGSNKLDLLEEIITIGTPMEYALQNSVSIGYVSSTAKRTSYSNGNYYEDLIQHTAPISSGSSGGPLFDLNGKLIGLNTLGMVDSGTNVANGLYFAVPIYPAMKVITQLVENNDTYSIPQLGVQGCDSLMASSLNVDFEGEGVYVISNSGSLTTGDVIKKITLADSSVWIIEERNDILYAMLNSSVGDSVTVEYERAGVTHEAQITLA